MILFFLCFLKFITIHFLNSILKRCPSLLWSLSCFAFFFHGWNTCLLLLWQACGETFFLPHPEYGFNPFELRDIFLYMQISITICLWIYIIIFTSETMLSNWGFQWNPELFLKHKQTLFCVWLHTTSCIGKYFNLVIRLFLNIKPIAICALNYSCINLEITYTSIDIFFWHVGSLNWFSSILHRLSFLSDWKYLSWINGFTVNT